MSQDTGSRRRLPRKKKAPPQCAARLQAFSLRLTPAIKLLLQRLKLLPLAFCGKL